MPEMLALPVRWKKPSRIFVNSMSDLFHEDVPDAFIKEAFTVMAIAKRHVFQVLTKRPKRMRDLVSSWRADDMYDFWYAFDDGAREVEAWPLPNVHLGVSCENQQTADERIPLLLQTPAAVRWVSAEPLLGPVTLNPWLLSEHGRRHIGVQPGLSWVVVGGESGPRARPCDVAWIRSVVQQCQSADVPVFVKQLGTNVRDRNDAGFDGDPGDSWTPETRHEELTAQGWQGDPVRIRLRDRKGGDPSEWPEDLRVRQFPREDR